MINKLKIKFNRIKAKGTLKTLKDFYKYHIYLRSEVVTLKRDLLLPTKEYRKNKQYSIKLLTKKSEFEQFKKHFSIEEQQTFSDHFDAQCECAICSVDNNIVAYLWVSKCDYYDKHLYKYIFKINNKGLYQFHGFVVPQYRGTLVSLYVLQFIWKHYLDEGYQSTCCAIDATNNIPSLRLHMKLGFKETGEILLFRKVLFFKWSTKRAYTGEYISKFYNEKRLDELGSILSRIKR